ncbi:MAG: helix-turn-helix transcriptional regulator [Eubacterium sp.]
MDSFGTRLKTLRKNAGLTQDQLSEHLNEKYGTSVNKGMISKWENNREDASMVYVKNLADFFKTTVDYLLALKPLAESSLTEKDEKDIAKRMKQTREMLEHEQGLMFDGEILDEETKDLLLELFEQQERMATLINKKYINKRYRDK